MNSTEAALFILLTGAGVASLPYLIRRESHKRTAKPQLDQAEAKRKRKNEKRKLQ